MSINLFNIFSSIIYDYEFQKASALLNKVINILETKHDGYDCLRVST